MGQLHVAIGVLCGTVGGPATYGKRLVAALAERDDVKISVVTDEPSAFAGVHAQGNTAVDVVGLPMRGGLDRLRWQYRALGKTLRRVKPDVYHDTKNALPLGLRVPAVVTVHDLAYHTVPKSFSLPSRLFLRWATKHAVRGARAVIVPSHATETDLRRFHPHCAPKIHVVPHGVDPVPVVPDATLAETRQRLALPARYVLHVGTIQARKNVDLVVQGVKLLRERAFPHTAVIVGRRGWLADKAIAAIKADRTVVWMQHASPQDLAVIYASAEAFVSPSAYEGFGFTVADALAAGVPTVISNISSLPELCGDGAMRLPELSAEAVAECLAAVFGNPVRTQAMQKRAAERIATFTWAASAAEHVRAYRAAVR